MEDGMRVELNSSKRVDINDELTRRLSGLLGATAVEMLIDRKQLSAKAEPKKSWSRNLFRFLRGIWTGCLLGKF